MKIDQKIAKKVLKIVDAGLVAGLGVPEPGKMCVEAAVCFAIGLPHSDEPSCVGSSVRRYKIKLNDANWSSDLARTKGMRKLAIAQLGSDQIDQIEFVRKLSEQTIKILIPRLFRKIASFLSAEYQQELLKAADRCEKEGSRDAADAAAHAAAAYAAYDDAAYAADADEFFILSADIALGILIEMKSPGCEFLHLCN